MNIVKGWRKLSNKGGYLNECSGQTLIVSKKRFSSNFQVLLFDGPPTEEADAKKLSPEFATESRADAFAFSFMKKHPDGMA